MDGDYKVQLYDLHQQAALTSPGLACPIRKHKVWVSFFSATPRGGGVALMHHSLMSVLNHIVRLGIVKFCVLRWRLGPDGHRSSSHRRLESAFPPRPPHLNPWIQRLIRRPGFYRVSCQVPRKNPWLCNHLRTTRLSNLLLVSFACPLHALSKPRFTRWLIYILPIPVESRKVCKVWCGVQEAHQPWGTSSRGGGSIPSRPYYADEEASCGA